MSVMRAWVFRSDWARFRPPKPPPSMTTVSYTHLSIIEFNVRGGDPETQVLLPLIDTPLVEIFQAVREQRLGKLDIRLNANHAVTVVMAAAGYPGTPETGVPIDGLEIELAGTCVFQGGTKQEGKRIVTNGGRVLSVCLLYTSRCV